MTTQQEIEQKAAAVRKKLAAIEKLTGAASIDEIIRSGKFRHDRHGHLLEQSQDRYEAQPYDEFADGLWAQNQELYERFWGPVPWLHLEDFCERLAEWLGTEYAERCIRGRTLLALPDTFDCDVVTRQWIYGPSDIEAVAGGARFEPAAAKRMLDFLGQMILYEGEYAGKIFRPLAWQVELFCRAFGWVQYSEDWGREVRRFRKVLCFVPKKNGKSPSGAVVGTYLTIGSGEKGAKTFSAAKDGKQAGIIHMHARQFVKRHDIAQGKANRLGCKINRSTGDIYHEESESYYRILSGDNIDGQEGLNGSVIIDETHVVDQRLANVLEYMGASRPEPMQFEISTAGRDPTGYGHGQYEYGRLVERGDVVDRRVLYLGFGIFDEPGHDVDALETHQRCNPSWFVTVKPSEFVSSQTAARQRGLAAYDTFLMYRLNKWLSGGSPWLNPAEWEGCRRSWELSDRQGQDAVLGIDLSRTRDMSAVAVMIREGDDLWLKTYLWITERYVSQWRDRMPQWQEWERAGEVTVLPGELIDYAAICERLERIAETVEVRSIVYDETYSAQLVQWIPGSPLGGAQLIAFGQSSAMYEGKIDAFEAAVKNGTLHHDGNRCLAWQAGHTETKPNMRGHRILVKPVGADDPRKIDGMVASVMALAGAMLMDGIPAWRPEDGV